MLIETRDSLGRYMNREISFPSLNLPDWLPAAIAAEAAELHAGILRKPSDWNELPANVRRSWNTTALNKVELLSRLTSDKRMEGVWRELYRRKRAPLRNEFLNPAVQMEITFDPPLVLHDAKNQDLACQGFFSHAFSLAVDRSRLPKKDEVKSRILFFSDLAKRLRQDAQQLKAVWLHEFAPALEAAAAACDKRAQQPHLDWLSPIVTRDRGDQVLRAFIVRLSLRCQETFKKWLSGTVATTTGVVFATKITGEQVRNIVRPLISGSPR